MARYAALLRGVNVGGHRRVPMAEFKALLESLGLTDVATYVQSGNAVFTAPGAIAVPKLAERIHEGLVTRLNVTSTVVIRSAHELAAVVADVPWPDRVEQPKALNVAYLSGKPTPAAIAAFDTSRFAPDELAVLDRAAYLWYPNGGGRTKLTLDVIERGLGVAATARNWTTVTTLARLTTP